MTPIPAKAKKTNPVTSSQSCPKTRPKWDAVARAAFVTAPKVRPRRARCEIIRLATRAAMPNFRVVETSDIAVILPIFGELGLVCRAMGLQYRGHREFGRSIRTPDGI
jgi:hypothetical protein